MMAAYCGWHSLLCFLMYIQLGWILESCSQSTGVTFGFAFSYLDHTIGLQAICQWSWGSPRSQFCFTIMFNVRRPCGYFSCLLLLCDDVHVNPGPMEHPCGIYKRSVNSNHRALLCDLYQCAWVSSETIYLYQSFPGIVQLVYSIYCQMKMFLMTLMSQWIGIRICQMTM